MIPDVPYCFTIRPLAEDKGGGYLIEFPDLPGCMLDGATTEEAITSGIDAMRGRIEGNARRGASDPRTAPLRGGMSRRPMVPLVEVCDTNLSRDAPGTKRACAPRGRLNY